MNWQILGEAKSCLGLLGPKGLILLDHSSSWDKIRFIRRNKKQLTLRQDGGGVGEAADRDRGQAEAEGRGYRHILLGVSHFTGN